MSYRLPKFTPFRAGERVQVRYPEDEVFSSASENGLWTVGYNSTNETWYLEDANGFLGGKQDWNIQWSANSDYVFLYRIEQVEEDPNAPLAEEESPFYYWIKTRFIYLGRSEIDGSLELVDLTEEPNEPKLDRFGWKFRNKNLNTTSTVTTWLESIGETTQTRIGEVFAHTAHLPTIDVTDWEAHDSLTFLDLRATTMDVDELNTDTLGTIRHPVTFRDRVRILIQNPSHAQESFLSLSDTEHWTYVQEEHEWILSNFVVPNGWTITSTTSGASQPNIQFRLLNSWPGYFLIRPQNNREWFLRHDLIWEDATDSRNNTDFEDTRTDLQWDVTLASLPTFKTQYVQTIQGPMISETEGENGVPILSHKTLLERNFNIVEAADILQNIDTDMYGHVTNLTLYKDSETNLARRAEVFQYEQRGWDAVGTANDLELYQDWIGVTEDQLKLSWWTKSGMKAASPAHIDETSVVPSNLQKKFVGAVTNPEGMVFFVPHQSNRALLFDPIRYETREIDIGSQAGDFAGGVLTETGKIACIPFDKNELWFVRSPAWIPEVPEMDQISLPPEIQGGTQKFFGGARMNEGEIVCTPHNAIQLAVYDTRVQEWSLYPLPQEVLNETDTERYRGAVACPDGQVVCIPYRAKTFLHVIENTTLVKRLPQAIEGLYVPDAEEFVSYPPGKYAVSVASTPRRQEDVTMIMDVRFPTFEEVEDDMCLFNAGATVRSVWIGIRRISAETLEFYVRAGDSRPPPDNSATILRIPQPSFLDGQVHRLLVDIQTDPGQLRVFIDDLLQGQRNINVRLANNAPDAPQWAGPDFRNMYGGTLDPDDEILTPFDEAGKPLSRANWYGFPHSILSPVRLYSSLRNPEPFLIPRAARLNWSRSWIQSIDTPELSSYDTIAPVQLSERGTSRWQLQHEWGKLVDSETFEFYDISIEPSSLLCFPRVPRLVNNDDGADTTHVQWQNWTFTDPTEWTCAATTQDIGNFDPYRVFQDENTLWRSASFTQPQSLHLHTPRPLRPRGYRMRAYFDENDDALQFVPLEWKLYGMKGDIQTELHHAFPGVHTFNNSRDQDTRTITILFDMEQVGDSLYQSYELEILSVESPDPKKVALERWDILFYPDDEDGFPIWNSMNKNTDSSSKGWRIFNTNVEGVFMDVKYHEPRRLHAIELTSGERQSTTNSLGIQRVAIEAKNVVDFSWKRIIQTSAQGEGNSWTGSFQTVRWDLQAPSQPYEMFRLVIIESDDPTYVCVQEWNLKTSSALPDETMFDNTDPFLVETGDTYDQQSPAYWGGAFTSRGIVCAPFQATRIAIYDITTRRLIQGQEVGEVRYADAHTLSNGMVALIPFDSNANLLIYDPTDDIIVSEHPINDSGNNAFAGGALTYDGQLVLAPYDAPDVRVLDVGIISHPALVTHPSVN